MKNLPCSVTWSEHVGGKRDKCVGTCHAIGSDLDGPWILIECEDGRIEQQRICESSDFKLE